MSLKQISGWSVLGSRHTSLAYYADSPEFPIGRIGDKSTPADNARAVVEQQFGKVFGPVYHLALAPHDQHNVVVTQDYIEMHQTVIGDAIMVQKGAGSFLLGTFVGDCAVLAIEGPTAVGMIHAGRPELMQGPSVIEAFFNIWPDDISKTKIVVGPSITGPHYEYDKADPNDPATCTTRWGTTGWDPTIALGFQLANAGINITDEEQVRIVGVDPFQMCLLGHEQWASDRFWKKQGMCSPRNLALVSYWHKDEDDD